MVSKKLYFFLGLLLIYGYGQNICNIIARPVVLGMTEREYYMNPKWSPDGEKIAFSGRNYQGLWVYNLKTETIENLSDGISAGYAYAWSSDSKNIISRVSRYDGVRRLNAVFMFGIEPVETIKITDFQERRIGIPGWSSDESRIYFSDNSKLKYADTSRKPLNGTGQPDLTLQNLKISAKQKDGRNPQVLHNLKNYDVINLVHSPDRTMIVFEALNGNIYTADTNGNNLTDLGRGDNPSWSPDGNYIVYSITKDDGHQFTSSDIYISAADGSRIQNITGTDDLLEMNPSWSPDGRTIAYDDYTEGIIYLLSIDLIK